MWYVRRPDGNLSGTIPPHSSRNLSSSNEGPFSDPGLRLKRGRKASETVQDKLDEFAKASQARSDDENLDALREELAKLSALSSPESIDQIAKRFEGWMEISERATAEGSTSGEGNFNANSAQILDVRREFGEDGEVRYISIMADAEGRTMEVELDDSFGESTYRTIKRLKANPLADRLYQRIVMPLFDKMIPNPADSATTHSSKLEPATTEAEENPVE